MLNGSASPPAQHVHEKSIFGPCVGCENEYSWLTYGTSDMPPRSNPWSEDDGTVDWVDRPMVCPKCRDDGVPFDHEAMRTLDRLRGAYKIGRFLPAKYRGSDPDQLVERLREWDGRSSFYITGPVGTGKTYQAAAFALHHADKIDGLDRSREPFVSSSLAWCNVPAMLEALRRSFKDDSKAPTVGGEALIILDDLGVEKPSEWVQERLYCLVNDRYENSRPIVVTSNLSINQLAGVIGERTASRLREMCGKPVGLGGEDRRRSK